MTFEAPAVAETTATPGATGVTSPTRAVRTLGGTSFMLLGALLFLASGAAGLIYQVAWVRILSLVFGVTIYALSAVLAGFMGGLALGSVLGGRLAVRVRSPLLAYGVIELGIAAVGLATPFFFGLVRDVYPLLYRAMGGVDASGPALIRLAFAFAVLLVPTTLMGMTLPVLLRSGLAGGVSMGRGVSVLYALNTFGAIAGTLIAGFFLIADLGVQGAIRTAAVLNLLAGVLAIGSWLIVRESLPTPDDSA